MHMSKQDPAANSAALASNLTTGMAIAMVLLAMLGAALTLANSSWSRTYWLLLVPIYGLLCTIAAWSDARSLDRMVMRQILHWISVGGAILLDFNFLQGRGQQTAAATGLSSLLILALGCLLAGIHLSWLFAIVGVLLFLMMVIVSVAQQYLALIFLLGGLVIVIFLSIHRIAKRFV
jgi:hypothetical protein